LYSILETLGAALPIFPLYLAFLVIPADLACETRFVGSLTAREYVKVSPRHLACLRKQVAAFD
jgi:hypothetical protein